MKCYLNGRVGLLLYSNVEEKEEEKKTHTRALD